MTGARKRTYAGRVPEGLQSVAEDFLNNEWDEHLIEEADVVATIAHVAALAEAGIVSRAEASKLTRALQGLEPFVFQHYTDEDVHSAIEQRLTEELGDTGAKVHTGRSRNDLVATDLRLWTRSAAIALADAVLGLVEALTERADETAAMLAPGYTHLQRGQPVTVGHWLAAHAFALLRDVSRVLAAHDAADTSSLGAGALAGNTLRLNPAVPAERLGFSRVFDNSVDAVSDRDFVADLAYAWTTAAQHLSRLAEEIVVWSSAEFGFVRPPDGFSTGSSMMPQKRNPDVAELARAESGAAAGVLVDLLVTTKGLALAYDRDLQAVKRAFWPLERAPVAFRAMTGMVAGLRFAEDRLREAASDDFLLATDLAEALVLRGVPFRRAHEVVGALALSAERAGTSLRESIASAPGSLRPLEDADAVAMLDPAASVRRRTTPGGPSPASMRGQVRRLRRTCASQRRAIDRLRTRLPTRRSAGSAPRP